LLALVLTEVLDDERLYAGDAEQALARGVDSEASEVACNPAAVVPEPQKQSRTRWLSLEQALTIHSRRARGF